jgi:hypothetical protein
MIILINTIRLDLPNSLRNIPKLVRTVNCFNSISDMPVTFHKKIKSSGYSSQPNTLKYSSKQKAKV